MIYLKTKHLLFILIFIIIILSFTLSISVFSPVHQAFSNQKKAVIVDQLSLTFPNQSFVIEAKAILEQSGYSVDYIQGENVTVRCYQNLASQNYNIIILRVYSALNPDRSGPLALFTSEPYDKNKYVLEQLLDLAGRIFYENDTTDKKEYYFGVSPKFFFQTKGSYNNSTVILMGCDGLTYSDVAEAFIKKGAKLFVGFGGPVTASYSDAATLSFLKHFVKEGLWVEKARVMTIADAGSDPIYDTTLWYYPLNADYKRVDD